VCLGATPAQAKTRIVVEKSYAKVVVTCAHPKGKFDVVAAGNQARAKDGTGISHLWVRKEGGKPELVAGPSEEGKESFDLVLRPLGGASTWPGHCHRLPVLSVDDRTVALVFERDNRPGPALAGVALYDVAKGRLVDVVRDVGTLVDARQLPGGAAVALGLTPEDPRQGILTLQDQTMSWTERPLESWSRVSLAGGKASVRGDLELSWEHGRWKPFFPARDDWARAAGWDATAAAFAQPLAYVASSADGLTRCVHFTDKRGVPVAASPGWACTSRK
jgi:hypothetical protein